MIHKVLFTAMAAACLTGASAGLQAQEKPVMATVVKISGIPWFDRMHVGVKEFAAATPSVTAFQNGPSNADAALSPAATAWPGTGARPRPSLTSARLPSPAA